MRILFFILTTTAWLYSKEHFTKEMLENYLTQENPFVYNTKAQEYIYKGQEKYFEGAFDTQLLMKYEKKRYPATEGDFSTIQIQKPLENGIEFFGGYRQATGVQEYNNIKTGENGEVLLGMKLPVSAFINGMNKRKLQFDSAKLNTQKQTFQSQDNLRLLRFEIFSAYYKALHSKALFIMQKELLEVAKQRQKIIEKRVTAGSLPEITLLEVNQQIVNREQRLIAAKNNFENRLEQFLQYLLLAKEEFDKYYILPPLPEVKPNTLTIEEAFSMALNFRADLKVFTYEVKKMDIQQQHARLLRYPNFNVGLYGVHDFKYNNGFKLSFDMSFPFQRRQYEGKSKEIIKKIQQVNNNKNIALITMKTKITQIIHSLKNIFINIQNSQKEIALVEKLQEAEIKKYMLGLSNLFMVNQRELLTLQTKKKLLNYILEYLLLEEMLHKEIGNNTTQQ
ncbi:MAG TPA: TolC family protein [Sulfurimonas autotrophica]|nr:TolC family protein [Sulfurimonas autotrophica]